MRINDMAWQANQNSRAKGFWDDPKFNVAEKLALIHSEVSEALECDRDGHHLTSFREGDGKPEGFPSELADIIIRIGDLAEHLGINLEHEIETKMAYNKTRPAKHGKAY